MFNPIIGDKSPHCRCKSCLHAFWLKTNADHDFLICNCDLMHSVTFPTDNEKIITCRGCEDVFNLSNRANSSACAKCNNSLWHITDKKHLYCYCLHLQRIVYGLVTHLKPLPVIVDCNGVSPIQEVSINNEYFPTNID